MHSQVDVVKNVIPNEKKDLLSDNRLIYILFCNYNPSPIGLHLSLKLFVNFCLTGVI